MLILMPTLEVTYDSGEKTEGSRVGAVAGIIRSTSWFACGVPFPSLVDEVMMRFALSSNEMQLALPQTRSSQIDSLARVWGNQPHPTSVGDEYLGGRKCSSVPFRVGPDHPVFGQRQMMGLLGRVSLPCLIHVCYAGPVSAIFSTDLIS